MPPGGFSPFPPAPPRVPPFTFPFQGGGGGAGGFSPFPGGAIGSGASDAFLFSVQGGGVGGLTPVAPSPTIETIDFHA